MEAQGALRGSHVFPRRSHTDLGIQLDVNRGIYSLVTMRRSNAARSTVALATGIVIGLVLVSIPFYWFSTKLAPPEAQNPGPGLASQPAYNQSEARVEAVPGGPWGLVSMVGLVAPASTAPFGWGQDRCQTLPGPTIWNLSGVRSLNTTLWGGRSVFWQMVYVNETYAMLFTADINGSVILDGPYGPAFPCVSYLENGVGGLFTVFPGSYWLPSGTFARGLVQALTQLDSVSWARTASNRLGNTSLQSWKGIVGYYALGYTWLNLVGWNNQGWAVWYQTCGIPGRSGEQPFAETGWGLNSSPSTYYGSENGGISCPVNTNADFLVAYNQTSSTRSGSGTELGEQLRIGVGSSGAYVYYDTANSLVSWMTRIFLNTSGGIPINPIAEACSLTDTSLSDCTPPTQSWYAVLISPNGWLMDAYPSASGGNQWETPNIFVTNNDTIVILSANSLIGTGDQLAVGPAFAFPLILGGITL